MRPRLVTHRLSLLLALAVLLGLVATDLLPMVNADGDPAAEKRAEEDLRACREKHTTSLVALARRWRRKDPVIARRALRRAFTLTPGCPAASKVAKQMGMPDLERTVFLYDGMGLGELKDADLPTWSVDGVYLRGDAPKDAYLVPSYERCEGDYTVRMEARVAIEYDGPSYLAMGGDESGADDRLELGLNGGILTVKRKPGKGKPSQTLYQSDPAQMRPPLKPSNWSCYELRFEGNHVKVYFDGRFLASVPRGGSTGGHVSLVAQHIAFQVRLLEVVKR